MKGPEYDRSLDRAVSPGSPAPSEHLIAEGRITPATRPKETAPDLIPINGMASDRIAEQRR